MYVRHAARCSDSKRRPQRESGAFTSAQLFTYTAAQCEEKPQHRTDAQQGWPNTVAG